MVLSLINNFPFGAIINGLAEIWSGCAFIKHSNLLKGTYKTFELIEMVAFGGAMYRIACFIILLKQGFLRIIDLDVDEYKLKGR